MARTPRLRIPALAGGAAALAALLAAGTASAAVVPAVPAAPVAPARAIGPAAGLTAPGWTADSPAADRAALRALVGAARKRPVRQVPVRAPSTRARLGAPSTTVVAPTVNGESSSTAARIALLFALAQLGKPYLWGGNGPAAYDCSGLTQQAYARAGVAIPRVAADQARIGAPVRIADLLPGDLVFYAYDVHDITTIHHVAMYLGDGLLVHAPQTGDVVRIAPMWLDGYAGAVRPTAAVPARVPFTVGTFPVPPAPPAADAPNPITRPEPLGPPPVRPRGTGGSAPASGTPAPSPTGTPAGPSPGPTSATPSGGPTATPTTAPSPTPVPMPSAAPTPTATAPTSTPPTAPPTTKPPTATPPATKPPAPVTSATAPPPSVPSPKPSAKPSPKPTPTSTGTP